MFAEVTGKTGWVGLFAPPYPPPPPIWIGLTDDASKEKKAKYTKKCVIKKIKFENYKNCLESTQLDNKINYLEKIIKNS